MIRVFRSKALAQFWDMADGSRLPIQNRARVKRILRFLNQAIAPEGMNVPGFRFHALDTTPTRWSVWVTGNYRLTFGWDGGDAVDVDIEDYH